MSRPLVVVGDALLDVDLVGTADRVTPDAPALVVESVGEQPRPGGAGLAARIAARTGREVVLVAAVADDDAGARLRSTLEGVHLVALPWHGATPVKQRIRVGGQTLLRLDAGGAGTLGPVPEEVRRVLAGAGAVLVSDYGRGVTAAADVRAAVQEATRSAPVVWDPHPRGSTPVPGVQLATPNQHEALTMATATGLADAPTEGLAAAHAHAAHLVAAWRSHAVAVTLGGRGALVSYGAGAPLVVPAAAVAGADTCGAGDCFAAGATAAMADGAVVTEAVTEAVLAATTYVVEGGPSGLARPPEPAQRRTGVVVATGGCFDLLHAGHVATLRAARALGDHLIVLLNSDASVRRLKGPGRPVVSQHDRARVLEALECVDEVVVFDEDTPVEALRRIRPAIWAKGGDYAGADLPEHAVLREWGGHAVVLPYLEGRSTTRLVAAAAARTQGADS